MIKPHSRTTSVRIGTVVHYKLVQLSTDLDIPIKDLIENAINEKYFGETPINVVQTPNTIPIDDLLELITRYKSQKITEERIKEQTEEPVFNLPQLPDWLRE